ncbi:MAG: hypothetical protein K2W96_18490 [Gemmataceae bacterium]|nr:hypothetical protein [Gemmataceae bacterium]
MDPTQEEGLVVTPGGPRRADLVRAVNAGEAVRQGTGGLAAVVSQAEKGTASAGASNAITDLVLTPGGYRSRSLVRQVGPNRALHAAGDRMLLMNLATDALIDIPRPAPLPAAVPALGSGWIAYAYWNNGTGTPISAFETMWRVPLDPATRSGQTIFLFNGIQDCGANYGILQPVLQWGISGAGGGPWWSVASWYVASGGQAFHTPLVRVYPGDALVGVMRLTGQSGHGFDYLCEFRGLAGTAVPVQNIAELLWCNETLQAYQISRCSDYPDATRTEFGAILVSTGSASPALNWTGVNRVTDCDQKAVVVSNSATAGVIDLHYRKQRRNRPHAPLGRNALTTASTVSSLGPPIRSMQ